jgi:hypothetical protein
MGSFRFYRRVHLLPGVSLNLSKSGPSLTMGMRGAHVSVGSRGVTRTVGLPGTGIYYTSRSGYHSGVHSDHMHAPASGTAPPTEHHVMGCATIAIIILVTLVIGVAIGASMGAH